jgi:hypothetical protein
VQLDLEGADQPDNGTGDEAEQQGDKAGKLGQGTAYDPVRGEWRKTA